MEGDEGKEKEMTKDDDVMYIVPIDDNRNVAGRAHPGGILFELRNGAVVSRIVLTLEALGAMAAIARKLTEEGGDGNEQRTADHNGQRERLGYPGRTQDADAAGDTAQNDTERRS